MKIQVLAFLFIITNAFANNLPYTEDFLSIVRTKFITNNQLDFKKIEQYKNDIEIRKNDLYEAVYNEERHLKNESKDESHEEAKDETKNYRVLLKLIKLLSETNDLLKAYELTEKILKIDYALKVEGNRLKIETMTKFTKSWLKEQKVFRHKTPLGEATNLYNEKENRYYNQNELIQMKRNGVDLSLLEPKSNSSFIDLNRDISKINVKEASEGITSLYKGVKLKWPKENEFIYRKVRYTQSKPKVDVHILDKKGKRIRFKIKFASEIHSEPTASALASTLGLYTDVNKSIKNFKLVLGDTTVKEFKRDWRIYYNDYEVNDLILEEGSDEKGNYIIFRDGLLEARVKPEDDYRRIGPWAWGEHSHQGLREARGLFLFNVWINNTDIKEAENNKLILKEKKDGDVKLFQLQHDMGFAFGNLFREKPIDFKWSPIKNKNQEKISFNFKIFQPNSGFEHVTWADARWMIRKISQLTRKQITDAFLIGGWPKEAREILVEKLISRRNELIKAFELENEVLKNGKTIQLMPVDYSKKEIKINPNIPDSSIDFSKESNEIMRVINKVTRSLFYKSIISGLNSIDKVVVPVEEFGLDNSIIAQVIFSSNRSISRNYEAKGEDDLFIVRNELKIGFRLGFGLIISGDVSFVKKFTQIHSVKSYKEGLDSRKHLINHTLPYDIKRRNLPEKHIVMIEKSFQTRGRIKGAPEAVLGFGPGVSAESSIYKLGSMAIINNGQKISLLKDQSNINEKLFKFFFQFPLVKYNIFKAGKQIGQTTRKFYDFSIEEFNYKNNVKAGIDDAFYRFDFSLIDQLRPDMISQREFEEKSKAFSFLFAKAYSKKLKQITHLMDVDQHGQEQIVDSEFLFQRHNVTGMNIFTPTERFHEKIQLISKINLKTKTISSPIVSIKYQNKDKLTLSKELSNYYIPFANLISNRDDFILFHPEKHSKNDRWGELSVDVDIEYDEHSLHIISNISKEELHENVLSLLNLTEREYRRLKSSTRPRRDPLTKRMVYKKIDDLIVKGFIFDARHFVTSFEKAKRKLTKIAKAVNQEERLLRILDFIDSAVFHDDFKNMNPIILGAVNKILTNKNFFVKAEIKVPDHIENIFPERIIPYNQKGKERAKDIKSIWLDTQNTLSIWQSYF